MNLSDDLDRWAMACRRDPLPEPAPGAAKPVDGRRYADGSGPRRRPWGASGLKGVYETPQGRWQAKLRHAGRVYLLGNHETAEEAARAVAGKLAELGEGL